MKPERPELEFVFAADLQHVRTLRQQMRDRLEAQGVADELTDHALLVLDEIVSNAIEHGDDYRSEGQLVIRIELQDAYIGFEFEDPDAPAEVIAEISAALQLNGADTPPPDSERGRGMFLIAQGVEDLVIEVAPGGGMQLRGRIGQGFW